MSTTEHNTIMEMISIAHEGMQYIFQNLNNEDPKMFYDRCMFIAKNQSTYSSKDELDAMSHIWVQKKYLQVDYEDRIEDLLDKSTPIYSNKPVI